MEDVVGETSSMSTVSALLLGVTKPSLGCRHLQCSPLQKQDLVGKAELLENIAKSCRGGGEERW